MVDKNTVNGGFSISYSFVISVQRLYQCQAQLIMIISLIYVQCLALPTLLNAFASRAVYSSSSHVEYLMFVSDMCYGIFCSCQSASISLWFVLIRVPVIHCGLDVMYLEGGLYCGTCRSLQMTHSASLLLAAVEGKQKYQQLVCRVIQLLHMTTASKRQCIGNI